MRPGLRNGALVGAFLLAASGFLRPSFVQSIGEAAVVLAVSTLVGMVLGLLAGRFNPNLAGPASAAGVLTLGVLSSWLFTPSNRALFWIVPLALLAGWLAWLAFDRRRLRPSTPLLLGLLLVAVTSWGVPNALRTRLPENYSPQLVIGLDAATWTVLDELFERSELPNLRRLVQDGSSGILWSEQPILSPRVWTTIATGKTPAQHGIEDFFSTQIDLRTARLWEILHRRGHSVGVFQWLITWPPDEIGAFIVPGWMARSPVTHPPELSFVKELEMSFQNEASSGLGDRRRWLGGYLSHGLRLRTCLRVAYLMLRDVAFDSRQEVAYAAKRRIQLQLNGDLYRELLRRHRPDWSAAIFYGTDNLAHKTWRYRYSEDFGISAEEAAPFAELLADYYRDADRVIGEILELVTQDAQIAVVSDHGYASGEPGSGRLDQRVRRPRMERLANLIGLQQPEQVTVASVAKRGYLTFRADVQDRVALQTRVADHLMGIRIASDGTPVFKLDLTPTGQFEVSVALADRYQDDDLLSGAGDGVRLGQLVGTEDRAGHHAVEGIVILHGRGIRRGARIENARLVDITPTLLYLRGLPLGSDMSGVLLEGAIDPLYRELHPVETIPSWDQGVTIERSAPIRGDEERLREQLRSMGYLD